MARSLTIFILFVSATLLFAASRLTLTGAGGSASGAVSSITVNTNWGSGSCGTLGCAVTLPSTGSRTLTVPAGNPGTITFAIDHTEHTCQYSKNGGAFTTFSNGGTLALANGDTLVIKLTQNVTCSFANVTVTITDSTTSASIGTAVATFSAGC